MVQRSINKTTYFLFIFLLCLSIKGRNANLECNGSIAQCEAENEMLMESAISRRFLEEGKHISFGALSRDQPACGGTPRGQAYSNNGGCLPPQENPYHRSCSKYYRCKRDD
ncbi:hypothetical protein RND81_05G171500 [Saponaria officinalis]|uniref:Protein RALF-like 32 n=1 Tax=Saponaria officinalis TaxID=3572 RepID=A0AAW1KT50_SAPOF